MGNRSHRLTPDEKAFLIECIQSGGFSSKELRQEFGISKTMLARYRMMAEIISGETPDGDGKDRRRTNRIHAKGLLPHQEEAEELALSKVNYEGLIILRTIYEEMPVRPGRRSSMTLDEALEFQARPISREMRQFSPPKDNAKEKRVARVRAILKLGVGELEKSFAGLNSPWGESVREVLSKLTREDLNVAKAAIEYFLLRRKEK